MSSPTPPDASNPENAANPAGDVVHAAEEFVERTVTAAERSLARRLGQRGLRVVLSGLRLLWMLTVLAYFAFGSTVLVTRYYLLPHIDDWRTNIESATSAALHTRVSIGRIEADWQGLRPRLLLSNVLLTDASDATVLALPQVEVVVAWTSLLALQPHTHSLTVLAPQVEVRRLRDHRFLVAGILIDPQAAQTDTAFVDWVLAQHDIRVRDARVHFVDELASTTMPATLNHHGASAAPSGSDAPLEAPAQGADAEIAPIDFTDVNFVLRRSLTGHHFGLQLRPPPELSALVDVRGQFTHPWSQPTARIASWNGRIFVQFDYVDLARIDTLTHLVPAPAQIQHASGALRAWIDFAALQVTRLRADVALTDVAAQLRPDLQPLRLDSVQGRITQTLRSDDTGQTQELALVGLRLDGPDQLHLPATDLLFRSTRLRSGAQTGATENFRFEANRIVLSDWSRLAAQMPLPGDWLAMIERTAARGTLDDLRATWDGPQTPPRSFSLRARFSNLGFSLDLHRPAADPQRTPGALAAPVAGEQTPPPARPYEFVNLAGSIDLDQDSGSLRIDANKAHVRLPFLYEDASIALNTLATRVRWSHAADSSLDVDVDSLAAANEDMELSASGSLREAGTAVARLDLTGRLTRAKVSATSRYLPAILAAPARSWLRGALIDGRVTEGSFYLHGDPKRFPFIDPRDGQFHAALHVVDGTLDVAPRPIEMPDELATAAPQVSHYLPWPQLTSIDADVVFDRNRLTVTARHGKAYGYELSNITARVPELDKPAQHLAIDGQGAGALGEMLHYLGDSPVNVWTGGWLASAQGSGPARLQLRLDIPLAKPSDTIVSGRVHLQGNNLVLRPDIAPFTAMTGELGFTQRGIQLAGITAGFLGGEVLLNGETLADGTVSIQGNGNATPAGIKRQVTAMALRRLLDRTRGVVQYGVKVNVRDRNYGLQFDSDLVGLAADLPEPFRKTAGQARPLHLERVPLAGSTPQRDTVRASLGSAVSVELHRVAGADEAMRVERGVIAIGAAANAPEAGFLLFIDQAQLDVDRWQHLLGAGANANGGSGTLETLGAAAPEQPGAAPAPGSAYGLDAIDLVEVHAKTLSLENKSISNVSLSAKRDPDQSWWVNVDSDQASGSLHWIGAHGSAPGQLTARLVKLAIPERDQKQVAELLDTPPTQFPALDVVADQFQLGSSEFGKLEIQAQNETGAGADTWHLQNLKISNPDGTLTAHGDWQRDSSLASRKMSLHIELSYKNAGEMLRRFGFPETIKNGSGKLDGDLSWRGSPFSIDYPSLGGKLHMSTTKGQFLKGNPGAGRLLGVLSLQAFSHWITGDFRDVVDKGFAFDNLAATASIDNGRLSTDDFIMKGVHAVVRIKGSTDLRAETQDLEVVVIPEINAGTASLAYALINPAIGLGTFIANFLLQKPLSAAFTNIYEVTGSWSDPKVERVKAEAGAVGARPAG